MNNFGTAKNLWPDSDGGKDEQYLAELLGSHHHQLKPWQPDDAQTRRLQQLVRHRRAGVDERTTLSNRLKVLRSRRLMATLTAQSPAREYSKWVHIPGLGGLP